MKIWAISDLHLSFGNPSKKMDVFGEIWLDHEKKIKSHWESLVSPEDLVLLPGDLCWSMRLEEAMLDLEWVHKLPGTKLLIKGNHDYWWPSTQKLLNALPSSLHILHGNAFDWHGVSIGGTRLWDTDEYSFDSYIDFSPGPTKEPKFTKEESEKIFQKELERLKKSLSFLNPHAHFRIAMTHYPPIGADLKESKASKILQEFSIDTCVFGHLHSLKKNSSLFEPTKDIRYVLTSCDYLNFKPALIYSDEI